MKVIDTRGQSCPIPVIMVKKAIASAEDSYQVLASNQAAVENISRFIKNKYTVDVNEDGGEFLLTLKKK